MLPILRAFQTTFYDLRMFAALADQNIVCLVWPIYAGSTTTATAGESLNLPHLIWGATVERSSGHQCSDMKECQLTP